MQLYCGGLALTETEVDTLLADGTVTEKTALARLRTERTRLLGDLPDDTQVLYLFWHSVGKWSLWVGGQWYDANHGPLAPVLREDALLRTTVRTFEIAEVAR